MTKIQLLNFFVIIYLIFKTKTIRTKMQFNRTLQILKSEHPINQALQAFKPNLQTTPLPSNQYFVIEDQPLHNIKGSSFEIIIQPTGLIKPKPSVSQIYHNLNPFDYAVLQYQPTKTVKRQVQSELSDKSENLSIEPCLQDQSPSQMLNIRAAKISTVNYLSTHQSSVTSKKSYRFPLQDSRNQSVSNPNTSFDFGKAQQQKQISSMKRRKLSESINDQISANYFPVEVSYPNNTDQQKQNINGTVKNKKQPKMKQYIPYSLFFLYFMKKVTNSQWKYYHQSKSLNKQNTFYVQIKEFLISQLKNQPIYTVDILEKKQMKQAFENKITYMTENQVHTLLKALKITKNLQYQKHFQKHKYLEYSILNLLYQLHNISNKWTQYFQKCILILKNQQAPKFYRTLCNYTQKLYRTRPLNYAIVQKQLMKIERTFDKIRPLNGSRVLKQLIKVEEAIRKIKSLSDQSVDKQLVKIKEAFNNIKPLNGCTVNKQLLKIQDIFVKIMKQYHQIFNNQQLVKINNEIKSIRSLRDENGNESTKSQNNVDIWLKDVQDTIKQVNKVGQKNQSVKKQLKKQLEQVQEAISVIKSLTDHTVDKQLMKVAEIIHKIRSLNGCRVQKQLIKLYEAKGINLLELDKCYIESDKSTHKLTPSKQLINLLISNLYAYQYQSSERTQQIIRKTQIKCFNEQNVQTLKYPHLYIRRQGQNFKSNQHGLINTQTQFNQAIFLYQLANPQKVFKTPTQMLDNIFNSISQLCQFIFSTKDKQLIKKLPLLPISSKTLIWNPWKQYIEIDKLQVWKLLFGLENNPKQISSDLSELQINFPNKSISSELHNLMDQIYYENKRLPQEFFISENEIGLQEVQQTKRAQQNKVNHKHKIYFEMIPYMKGIVIVYELFHKSIHKFISEIKQLFNKSSAEKNLLQLISFISSKVDNQQIEKQSKQIQSQNSKDQGKNQCEQTNDSVESKSDWLTIYVEKLVQVLRKQKYIGNDMMGSI